MRFEKRAQMFCLAFETSDELLKFALAITEYLKALDKKELDFPCIILNADPETDPVEIRRFYEDVCKLLLPKQVTEDLGLSTPPLGDGLQN